MKSPYQNAIPFEYALLETYKRLGINEEEAFLALLIDHLREQGNRFINADLLSLKMSKKPSEISTIMNSLFEKGLLRFDMKGRSMETTINPLREKAYAAFTEAMERQRSNVISENNAKELSLLYSFFEENLGRTLSPLEKDSIADWLDLSYSVEEIKNALLDTLRAHKKTIRAVEKTLKARRKENDLLKEGASGINDSWDKDIEETMALTKRLWGKK